MTPISRQTLSPILRKVIAPLARFCIRNAVRAQDLYEFCKVVLLEEAAKEIRRRGQSVTASRLSAITGLQRRDVAKYVDFEVSLDDTRDRIRKVIGAWQGAKAYRTKSGSPRILSYGGEQSEFSSLVKSISKDLNPATILFELERIGVVEKSATGIRLLLDAVSPREDPEAGFDVVASDIHDLIRAAEENLFDTKELPNLHVRTEYDRVRSDAIPEIRQWMLKEGHALHARAREYVSQFDQDINPVLSYKGKLETVVLQSFGRTYKPDLDGE